MPAKSISSVEGTDLQYGTDLVLEYLQTFGRGQGQHPPDEREVDPVFVIGSGLVGHHSEPPSPPLRSVRRRSRVSAIRSSARMFSPSRSDLAHNCLTLARSSMALERGDSILTRRTSCRASNYRARLAVSSFNRSRRDSPFCWPDMDSFSLSVYPQLVSRPALVAPAREEMEYS